MDFDRRRGERFAARWHPARVAIVRGDVECSTCRTPFATRFLLSWSIDREGLGGNLKGIEPEAIECPTCLERKGRRRSR